MTNTTALVVGLPGTDAFTMAVFRSDDVPAGSIVGIIDPTLQGQNNALVQALKAAKDMLVQYKSSGVLIDDNLSLANEALTSAGAV